ncbi:MAG TPA: antitoxin Xre/MbcA/ParS toxin-binding domain-containing protein [Polyangiaceae bacterium]|nr:antitoxin Xre/MbcA/ParS toxin-binding domain-containing protein [Polyangiaceae bacterium]
MLGRTPKTSLELVGSIRSGLPYAAFEALAKQAELSTEEAESALLIPRRTLARRKTAGTLDAGSSERVVRLARIAARALDVFEDDEAAVTRWLRTPLRELAGETPLSLVDTDLGAQEALDVLERIEDGIFG